MATFASKVRSVRRRLEREGYTRSQAEAHARLIVGALVRDERARKRFDGCTRKLRRKGSR